MTKQERYVRRLADKQGLALRKSRIRTPVSASYLGYMILDRETGYAVAGVQPFPYSLTLEAAEGWLEAEQ